MTFATMAQAVAAGPFHPFTAFTASIDNTLLSEVVLADLYEKTESDTTVCGESRTIVNDMSPPHTPLAKLVETIDLSPDFSHRSQPQTPHHSREQSHDLSFEESNPLPVSPLERVVGLPSITHMSQLPGSRPRHVRHSSLRHEYHPMSPQENGAKYSEGLNLNTSGLGSWTSPSGSLVSGMLRQRFKLTGRRVQTANVN